MDSPHLKGDNRSLNERIPSLAGASAQERAGSALRCAEDGSGDSDSVVPVLTFVIWSVCLGVGVLGLRLPYAHPRSRARAPEPPVQALQVELKTKTLPRETEKLATGPTMLPMDSLVPAPLAVARPLPAIAFAVPVATPVRIVPLGQADYSRPTPPVPQPPRVQTLTFGEGEGRQPAPEYPRRALQERQQGVVVIRFVVGENGRVSSAEATQPCAWPVLNEAALRTVRERWQFPAGVLRVYEIAIRFQLAN